MKRGRLALALACGAVVAAASLVRAQSLPAFDCETPLENATPGHYRGEGAVAMTASGRIEMVDVRPIQFRAPYTLDFTVTANTVLATQTTNASNVSGTFSIQAPVSGTFNTPYGTVRGQRQESDSGALSGIASKGRRLTAGDFTLQVQSITCSQIVGTMLVDRGFLAELQAEYRGAGLSVTTESTAFTASLDGRDAALEAQVGRWIAEAAATPPLGPGTRAMIATTLARARSIEPPGPPGTDPYRSCLARQVTDAAASLAGRRAQAQLARLRQPMGTAASRLVLLRETTADLRAAEMLGCDIGSSLDEVTQAWFELTHRLAELGAPAERLAMLVELLGHNMNAEVTQLMGVLNGAAAAGGHPLPFPPAASP